MSIHYECKSCETVVIDDGYVGQPQYFSNGTYCGELGGVSHTWHMVSLFIQLNALFVDLF